MRKIKILGLTLVVCFSFIKCGTHKSHSNNSIEKHAAHAIQTPDEAILELKNGNKRFLQNKPINTNYKSQIEHTKSDQHPHTLILSCLDSRIPPEIIFDQGIGNIFVVRNAGNIEDQNILGSMEFATKVKGTKLIVVMGHNHCGAVKGAVDDVELGHLTQLVNQIKPAIVQNEDKKLMLDETSKNSVQRTIDDILRLSHVIEELVKKNQVKIVGAYYNIENGKVTFFD